MKIVLNLSIIAFFLILSKQLYAQELSQKQQAVYASVGFYQGLYYERTVIANDGFDSRIILGGHVAHNSFFVNTNSLNLSFASVHAIALLGKNDSFFELGLGPGVVLRYNQESFEISLVPKIIAGYRLEIDKYLFRVGIGTPEFVYASAGFRF